MTLSDEEKRIRHRLANKQYYEKNKERLREEARKRMRLLRQKKNEELLELRQRVLQLEGRVK